MRAVVVVVLVMSWRLAAADRAITAAPPRVAAAERATADAAPGLALTGAPAARRQLLYVEAFGRAGAYGVGWEIAITPRLGLGVAGSFAVLGGQQLYTVAPYLHARLLGSGRHALFGELGFAIVHSRVPSPVPEWDGTADTGAGGQATLGWQWQRGRMVTRSAVGVAAGEGGIAPFAGVALGVRL